MRWSSCEVSFADPAAGIDDTGLTDIGTVNIGPIWLVTCSGTQRMICL